MNLIIRKMLYSFKVYVSPQLASSYSVLY